MIVNPSVDFKQDQEIRSEIERLKSEINTGLENGVGQSQMGYTLGILCDLQDQYIKQLEAKLFTFWTS